MLFSRMARIALAALGLGSLAAAQQAVLTGRVVDENDAPLDHAHVTARRGPEAPLQAYSGPSGQFRIVLPALGTYLLGVQRPGYFELKNQPVDVPATGTEITLALNVEQEVFQAVQVGAVPDLVDPDQTQREQRLSGTTINNVPYPASHSLRNAMKLIPGVVQDPTGGVHFHGGAEYQTRYVLDGFDITDPIDGRYSTRLAVEGVRSLDLLSSRETPQYGRGSAGTLEINTENGTDQFRYTATNFIPGLDYRGGLRFGDWTPRAGFSGPIRKGRAWFSDSFDGEYNSGYVAGLPNGQNTNALWAAGNLFHVQVNLTPRDILYTDVLSNYDHQSHFGLGVLDPVSTTSELSDSEWMVAGKELHSWYGGAMLEVGAAWQRVLRNRVPQGSSLYFVTPNGRSGNYFVRSSEDGRRGQFFVNYYVRALHAGGRHQIQIGADAQRLDYTGDFQRSGYEEIGLNGVPAFLTAFRGSGMFERPGLSVAAYVNDHWQPAERLMVDAGIREDWDELARTPAVSPRVSVSYAPGATHTKITGGVAMVTDAVALALFSRPLDQQPVTTPFSPEGVPGVPLATTFLTGHDLKLPQYTTWSAGVQHDFGRRVDATAEWLRKRGRDGFVYAPVGSAAGAVTIQPVFLSYGFGGTYELSNLRRDAYDELALTVRQSFGDQYGWMASYTRSRAVSNAVLDVNVDQPLQVEDNFGRMPWDAPNRVLGWAYLPVPYAGKKWAAAMMVDYRTGFPFAVVSGSGVVAGAVDSHCYPSNFDLNLHIERRFEFAGYRFAIRVGANNLTDHRNPTAVNNVIGSPQYLQFFGDEGRHFVIRVRVFGRAAH